MYDNNAATALKMIAVMEMDSKGKVMIGDM